MHQAASTPSLAPRRRSDSYTASMNRYSQLRDGVVPRRSKLNTDSRHGDRSSHRHDWRDCDACPRPDPDHPLPAEKS